jgi:hypothetical protein
MCAVGRGLKFSLPDIDEVLLLVIIASAYALVGVLSPWAMLRGRLVVVRGVILLIIAAAAGWGVFRVFPVPVELAFWIGIALAEAVLLVVSLLVVRSCGYRLMRRRKLRVGQAPRKIA